MNARYQKNTAPSGKTRKSAASAKPSRSGASASTKSTPAKGSSAGKSSPSVWATPDTPEFRKWRRLWWVSVVAALALTLISFALLSIAKQQIASNIVLGLAYAAIFMTLAIDWIKIRPMRKAAYQAAKSGKPVKAAEKADKAQGSALTETTTDTDTSDTDGKA